MWITYVLHVFFTFLKQKPVTKSMELEKKCVKHVCRNPINTIGHRDTDPLSNESWSRLITINEDDVYQNFKLLDSRKKKSAAMSWNLGPNLFTKQVF